MRPTHPPRPRGPGLQPGFTLVELVIAMAVLGLLASLAYPSFIDALRKSRRSEGIGALMAVQQAQERWRANNANYTTNLADLSVAATTPSGYYTISVAQAPASAPLATAYVATAIGKAGTSQEGDAQCRRLSVELSGGNLRYAGCGSCGAFSYAATHICWAR